MKKLKVFVAVPTMGTIVDSQVYILRDIEAHYKDQIELVYPSQCVRRMFHDFARNMLVEEFLSTDCDILWFLDSDITPALHILDLVALYKDKWQVAGSVYPVFMTPPGGDRPEVVLTCYKKNPETGALAISSVPSSGTGFVDGLATGCLFIKREVFSKLEAPYFSFKFNAKDKELIEGEDLGFCKKLSELGIQFFTDFGLVCKHQKNIDLLEVNNYAIGYANRSIQSYEADIKAHLQGAIQAAHDKGFKAGLQSISAKAPKKGFQPGVIWTP